MANQVGAKDVIRSATVSDIDDIWRLVEAYACEVASDKPHPCRSVTLRTVRGLIGAQFGFVRVLDRGGVVHGVMLAAADQSPWVDEIVAQYLLLYVSPEYRSGRWAVRFLDAFEAWAKDVGAGHVAATDTGVRLERLLRRRGYGPGERVFLRAV